MVVIWFVIYVVGLLLVGRWWMAHAGWLTPDNEANAEFDWGDALALGVICGLFWPIALPLTLFKGAINNYSLSSRPGGLLAPPRRYRRQIAQAQIAKAEAEIAKAEAEEAKEIEEDE